MFVHVHCPLSQSAVESTCFWPPQGQTPQPSDRGPPRLAVIHKTSVFSWCGPIDSENVSWVPVVHYQVDYVLPPDAGLDWRRH